MQRLWQVFAGRFHNLQPLRRRTRTASSIVQGTQSDPSRSQSFPDRRHSIRHRARDIWDLDLLRLFSAFQAIEQLADKPLWKEDNDDNEQQPQYQGPELQEIFGKLIFQQAN